MVWEELGQTALVHGESGRWGAKYRGWNRILRAAQRSGGGHRLVAHRQAGRSALDALNPLDPLRDEAAHLIQVIGL